VLGSAEAEQVWLAITSGDVKPANVAVQPVRSPLSFRSFLLSILFAFRCFSFHLSLCRRLSFPRSFI
jgi:hypothetical protein